MNTSTCHSSWFILIFVLCFITTGCGPSPSQPVRRIRSASDNPPFVGRAGRNSGSAAYCAEWKKRAKSMNARHRISAHPPRAARADTAGWARLSYPPLQLIDIRRSKQSHDSRDRKPNDRNPEKNSGRHFQPQIRHG